MYKEDQMKRNICKIVLIVCFSISFAVTLNSQEKLKFEKPVLITSAGQSADVTLAGMLCKKSAIEAKSIAMATSSDLSGVKTLIIVAGFSSKGLGAAGVSREQELDRVKSVIKAAKEKKIKIIMMHIGGKSRRGVQSDDFNKMAAEASDYMFIVKQGDEDQFFTNLAKSGKIPMKSMAKIVEVAGPLAELFN
jgi:hypothetical protein